MAAQPQQGQPPHALLELAQWVTWRKEKRQKPNGDIYWTKVPYNPKTGKKASVTAPSTWATYPEATWAARHYRHDGVGFVVTKGDPFVGIDLDHCRDSETGEIEAWALAIVEQMRSYTEVSPSGTGLRIFVMGSLPPMDRREGDIEIYESGRFLTVTGLHLPGAPMEIETRQEELDALHQAVFASRQEKRRPAQTQPSSANPTRLDDTAIIKQAQTAKNGAKFARLWNGDSRDYSQDASRADMALCGMLAFWTGPDADRIDRIFRQSGLMRVKWDESRGASSYGARTIAAVLATARDYYSDPKVTPMRQPRQPIQRETPPTDGSSALKYADTPPDTHEQKHYALTEMGNAERLFAAHGEDIRYCKAFGFCVWESGHWRGDGELTVRRWAKKTIRAMYAEAAGLAQQASGTDGSEESKALAAESMELLKWARKSETARMIDAMLSLIRDTCEVDTSIFDAKPMLFNARNGTIDLTTGALRPHSRDDYLMQCAPTDCDPMALCPTFARFVEQIMCNREDLVMYLQRALGYSLSGSVKEQVWHLLIGEGENGKSTLVETVAYVLGEYAGMLEPESVTVGGRSTDPNAPSPAIASLKGKRFVKVTETEEGARIAPARIKRLSGADELSGRHLNRNLFSFMPSFKLWLYTNHRPQVRETKHAFWRRVRYIPFDFNLRELPPEAKDAELPDKLRAEAPGILAWLVRGCLAWQSEGLKPPKEVMEATESYKRDSDLLQTFLDEHVVLVAQGSVPAKAIYERYTTWCEEYGEHPMSQRRLGEALAERGFERKHWGTGWIWLGMGLAEQG